MADPKWRVEGDNFETCNCDFLCPCITSNMRARPTKGDCKAALVFQINKGTFGSVRLDGRHLWWPPMLLAR